MVDPEGEPELVRRGRVDDHRRAVREQDRGAKALDRSEGDHLGRVERQARQEGANREHGESARVQLHAADDVRDAPDEEERDRTPEDVRLGDPDRLFQVGPKACGDLREADDHDAGVDPGHEHAHGRDRQDRPPVLDPARLRRRSSGRRGRPDFARRSNRNTLRFLLTRGDERTRCRHATLTLWIG